MGENNASVLGKDDIVSELEKLNISSLDTEWLTEAESREKTNLNQPGTLDQILNTCKSVSKKDFEIDTQLSELQCPFTWPLPRTGIKTTPSDLVSKLTDKAKETEDNDQFKFPKFIYNMVIVFELYNDGKLEEANKKLSSVLSCLADLYRDCTEVFFVAMKRPLQHLIVSYKAYLLKAYRDKLVPLHARHYYQGMDKILSEVYPYSEMTDAEKAGIHGIRAQIFTEYGFSGTVSALEYAKQAIELDPHQAEWHFLTGKIMGRVRRCANWNDYVTKEEINFLEHAVELHEKPSYMVFLACAYIECTRNVFRSINVDRALSQKLSEMNSRAKKLFTRCLELNPDCSHISIRCASGMMKLPKFFVDKDVVEKCIAFALEKAPNNGMVHHVAGMFAERHKYDIEKALHHYKISSDLCVFGATADYIRLKYTYEKDFDLLSGLHKMLDNSEALPNRYGTLSSIGSYYLYLKRDLITALDYYGQIMDADRDSSALKAHKPPFLSIKTPLNLYEIICTEVHLELNKDELTKQDKNLLKEFINKLNKIDPTLSEKFAGEPSQIQIVMDESVMLTEKYKANVNKQQKFNRRDSGTHQSNSGSNFKATANRARSRGCGGQQNVRRQSNSTVGSWRNRGNDTGESEIVEASVESMDSACATKQTSHQKKDANVNNYMKVSGKPKTMNNGNNEIKDRVARKECDTEIKSIQKFQKNKLVQTIRDPYGPNEEGVQKPFERKRVPDKKWI